MCPHHHPHITILTSTVLWTVDTVDTVNSGQWTVDRPRGCGRGNVLGAGGAVRREQLAPGLRFITRRLRHKYTPPHATLLSHTCPSHTSVEYHRRFCGGLAGCSQKQEKSIYLRTTKSHNITRQRQSVFCVKYCTSKERKKSRNRRFAATETFPLKIPEMPLLER